MTSDPEDTWVERLGDWINPILVRETRQALKSRQFTITFLLVLVANLVVSLGGVALAGPGLSYRPFGVGFFLAYYTVLAFAVFVVVPFGAYRSLATEYEERTFELISISALRPGQIITGKLLSAIVQTFIYYSASVPYMSFTILLKGIDVPSIVLVLSFSVLVSIGLSMIGLLFASSARRRGMLIFLSVAIVSILLSLTVISIPAVGSIIVVLGPYLRETSFWMGVATALTVYVSYVVLGFQLSSAQLTFEADNRSSRTRVALAVQFLLAAGWIAYWWVALRGDYDSIMIMTCVLCVHWFVTGAFLVCEREGLSKRVARQVPRHDLWRTVVGLFFPGPGTGLAFLLSNLVCLVALVGLAVASAGKLPVVVTAGGVAGGPRWPTCFALAAASYVFLYCGLGAWVLRQLRRWKPVPVLGGAAITWLIAALGCVVPTFFVLVSSNPQFTDYRIWQITDPIATLAFIGDNVSSRQAFVLIPSGMALLVFLLNLRSMAQAALEIHAAGHATSHAAAAVNDRLDHAATPH